MIVKLEVVDVEKAVANLTELYHKVRFTSKNGRQYVEFPPGTSAQSCADLRLLSIADQTVHQEYLPMVLKQQVSTVRNMYTPKP